MFLGIDLGTSGVKTVVVSPEGDVLAQSTAPLSVERPHELWSEQDPQAWWAATDRAVLMLDEELRGQVAGIGLAGQMHGAVLLGADDAPLRSAILWNDGRSFAECEELEEAEPHSREITGNIAMPGFTAPKLLWVRCHEPEVFERIHTVLLPKDYLRLMLTGDKASEMSDAAGTLWLDVAQRSWSDRMLAASGLDRSAMPALVEGSTITGQLRSDVARRWAMRSVPVAAGGGDNAAAAAGVGVIGDGDALLSLGTSGVTFVATNEFRPNPGRAVHAFCHCLPGRWHQMAVHLSAASCIDWAARQLGLAGPAEVLQAAAHAPPGTGPEIFLPYLSGERTPFNDPHVRAGWLGLDNDSDPARLAAAVLEGVAFGLADGLDALREAGSRVDELVMVGGGARSTAWGTIISSVLQARLVYIEGGDIGPSLGAAKLAQLATLPGAAEEVCRRPTVTAVIEPDSNLSEILSKKRTVYQAASAAVCGIDRPF